MHALFADVVKHDVENVMPRIMAVNFYGAGAAICLLILSFCQSLHIAICLTIFLFVSVTNNLSEISLLELFLLTLRQCGARTQPSPRCSDQQASL